MKAGQTIMFLLIISIIACNLPISGKKSERVIEVSVKGITIDPQSNSPVVVLEDKDSKKLMPIWIGYSEARAIATELEGISLPRPMTHDLLKSVISGLNASVERIIITELKNSTFFAVIELKFKRKIIDFDSRPSDAIALALRFHAPIYVSRDVFNNAQTFQVPQELPEGWQDVIMGFSAQELTSELSEAMGLKSISGVVVTDVLSGSSSERDGLKRGDIIISANKKEIKSLRDLVQAINEAGDKPMDVTVLREGRELKLTLHPGEGE